MCIYLNVCNILFHIVRVKIHNRRDSEGLKGEKNGALIGSEGTMIE